MEDEVWTSVWRSERRTMTVSSDEDVGGRTERCRHMSSTRVLVGLRARCVFVDQGTEASEVRRSRSTREEFCRHYKRIAVYHLGGGYVGTFFGSGSEPKEDPRKMRDPRSICAAGDKGSFEGSMHPFDEAIGFRIVCCCRMMC